jgi:hypothetical protein
MDHAIGAKKIPQSFTFGTYAVLTEKLYLTRWWLVGIYIYIRSITTGMDRFEMDLTF